MSEGSCSTALAQLSQLHVQALEQCAHTAYTMQPVLTAPPSSFMRFKLTICDGMLARVPEMKHGK